MSEFELEKMEFSNFNSLVNVSKNKSKMLIGSLYVVRVLIMRVLMSCEFDLENKMSENSKK